MAADSGVFSGSVWLPSGGSKLLRLSDGSIVGCAGWRPAIRRGVQWLELLAASRAWHYPESDWPAFPRAPEEGDDLDLVILRPDGVIWHFCRKFELYPSEWPIAAAGSDSEFLYGAMLAGASAEEAVDLAIAHVRNAQPPRVSMRH